MTVRFEVYIRYGCHLCEEMIEHLNLLKNEYDFDISAIDITGKDDLEQQYGLRVPVLVWQQQEICHYALDVKKFRVLMNQVTNN